MKFLFLLNLFILLAISTAFGQDSLKLKTNPIIYGDLGFSIPLAGIGGIQFNSSLNFQHHKSLFTLRVVGIQSFTVATAALSPFTVFPYFKDAGSLVEFSFLDGWRTVDGNHAFSISGGISYNDRVFIDYPNNKRQQTESRYAGLPFEMNILWFKARKQKYHIYYLIPVGRPTGFGHSFGLKLSGNISQHSYVSFGTVFGWGFHKEY